VKNAVLFTIIFVTLIAVIAVGLLRPSHNAEKTAQTSGDNIPYIGRVQVLNGCGIPGAGNTVADFLRSQEFDVKDIQTAQTGNYPVTYIVSRIKDMAIARNIAQSLSTGNVFLLRNGDETYDVTVFVGSDYPRLIAGNN